MSVSADGVNWTDMKVGSGGDRRFEDVGGSPASESRAAVSAKCGVHGAFHILTSAWCVWLAGHRVSLNPSDPL